MKLQVAPLSQRDSRWGSITLGYNSPTSKDAAGHFYNIYWYGCLITSLSVYVIALNNKKNPDEVNQILKDNDGFVSGSGELIWSKTTVLGLEQDYLSPTYSGPVSTQGIAKMKELIGTGHPLIMEIDFNPATSGEEQHFVLGIGIDDAGEILVADPWTGTIVSLAVYGGTARAVIRFRSYKQVLSTDSTPDCAIKATAFDLIADILQKPRNPDIVIPEVQTIIGYEDIIRDKDILLQQKDEQNKKMMDELAAVKDQLRIIGEANQKLSESNTQLKEQITTNETEHTKLQQTIEQLDQKVTELQKVQPIEQFSGISLMWLGIKKVFHIS